MIVILFKNKEKHLLHTNLINVQKHLFNLC